MLEVNIGTVAAALLVVTVLASRLLYFKKLMMKAEVNSHAKTSHIWDNLSSRNVYMQNKANINILDFNYGM
jgi:hypothetical protein